MRGKRPSEHGRIAVAVVVAGGLLVAGASAAQVVTGGAAGAVGTTHRTPASARSTGTDVEGSARASLRCNDATGAYTLSVTNVQVIQTDGVTPWHRWDFGDGTARPYVTVTLTPSGGPAVSVTTVGSVPLVDELWGATSSPLAQNTTNGLFALKVKGNLADIDANWMEHGLCQPGSEVHVFGDEHDLGLPRLDFESLPLA